MKKILLWALCLLALTGCQSDNKTETAEVQACGDDTAACAPEQTAEKEFEMEEISMDQAIEKFKNKDSFVLYFGFEDCPWCKEAVPVLEEEAAAADQKIYFVRTRDADRQLIYTDEQKEEIIPFIGDYMDENDEGILTLYVPLVVVVKDGQVIDGHLSTIEGHNAHERKMTAEETAELHEIYKSMLN